MFNAVIDSLDSRKIRLFGWQFTWTNNLQNQTFEKIDWVIMTAEWETKFPLVSVHALEGSEISDHVPLLVDLAAHADEEALHPFTLNCGGFFEKDSTTVYWRCGTKQTEDKYQSKGGTTKSAPRNITSMARHQVQPELTNNKRKIF